MSLLFNLCSFAELDCVEQTIVEASKSCSSSEIDVRCGFMDCSNISVIVIAIGWGESGCVRFREFGGIIVSLFGFMLAGFVLSG